MSLSKHIFKVGAWTGVSRILGFARDLMIAAVLGAGVLSDIFLAAFKLPNLFRDWLGEGALSVAFVPMFAEYKTRKNIAQYFASNAFSWLMLLLLVITILAQIFMPLVIMGLAPGFSSVPGKAEMTVFIARILFFYIFLVCGVGFMSAILNAFSEFAYAAMMPALLNVFMIGGLLFVKYFGLAGTGILYVLSAAVLVAGVVQLALLLWRLSRRQFGLKIIRPRMTGNMKTLFKRIGVGFIGTGFYQINIVLGTLVASFQSGAISYLYYADRMVQLPFAIIGLAAGTVLLTSLSDAIKRKNMNSVYRQQNAVMTGTLIWIFPAMFGLIALAVPIMQFVFERGAWTHAATLATAAAIMIQALALPAMSTSQIYQKTLYAAKDMKTPVKLSVISLFVSAAIYIALFHWIGYLAVPVGSVVGGYLRNTLLVAACRRRGLFKMSGASMRRIAVFLCLAAVMGAGLWLARGAITGLTSLVLAIALAGAFYMPVALFINRKVK
ncbi:MAG: murein biosynthesis integral membrane protein MurJ [Alphaproteobacteria bacterium]|nr:murein biosynthesis integral membrane protein MurJ [Alphaproteobacteria bacterium]